MSGSDESWRPAVGPPEEIDAGPIVLRRYRPSDLDELAAVIEASRDHLAKWLPWAATADGASLADFIERSGRAWDDRTTFNYAMREPGGEVVGGIGLHPRVGPRALEIGYWVRADRINRGYASAAAGALTAAALALPDVDRVEIHCDEANVRSAAVPRKIGFRLDRIEPDEITAPAEAGRSMIWVQYARAKETRTRAGRPQMAQAPETGKSGS